MCTIWVTTINGYEYPIDVIFGMHMLGLGFLFINGLSDT
jgi:hypothetical protein